MGQMPLPKETATKAGGVLGLPEAGDFLAEIPCVAHLEPRSLALFGGHHVDIARYIGTPSCSRIWGISIFQLHAQRWSRCVRTSSRISRNDIGRSAWARIHQSGRQLMPLYGRRLSCKPITYTATKLTTCL